MRKITNSAASQVKKYLYTEEMKRRSKIKKRMKKRGYENYDITSVIPVKIVMDILEL